MPAALRAQLFKPWSSKEIRSLTGDESSGLGLAFCRAAVEAQGGTIAIDDRTERGATFIVELPR